MANERLIFLAWNIYSILAEYSLHSCTFRWASWLMGLWLAHLSWRLIGELIVYACIRRLSVFGQHFQTSPLNPWLVGWLCWGLTSQSTIFQSCRDGAIASWVINQYFRGVKCLAQGHNTATVGLEPRTSRSGIRHSTTEPPRSPLNPWSQFLPNFTYSIYRPGKRIFFFFSIG